MPFGQPLQRLESTDSTNRVALDWLDAPHGAAVIAQTQTAGRGRLGRVWDSPPDVGLYLSLILRPVRAEENARFALVAALSIARALEKAAQIAVQTKWPNDLLARGQKIGGILCEARGERLVVGIGANLNQQAEDLPERPIYPASSLLLLTGRRFSIDPIAASILVSLEADYNRFCEGDWPNLKAEFRQRCANLGEVVRLAQNGEQFYGVAREIEDDGALLVQTADGPRRVVAGEIGADG